MHERLDVEALKYTLLIIKYHFSDQNTGIK